ncbi:MAG: hypothetical protein HC933_13330 [Pleurocapsa sp. SU_196_0]|nr:hypothetical protein [Pleurocapsa sp. SU_196_0]
MVAQAVLKNSVVDWLWAQATAYCTMAYLSSSSGDFAEAVSSFKKSAECYEAAGDRHRWAGVLNNQAIELNRMAEHAGRLGEPIEVIEASLEKAETAYRQALEGLVELEVRNKPLEGRILLNMGKISETRGNWVEAGRRYTRAEETIVGLPLQGLFARIRLNLGIIHRKMGLLSEAAVLFRETITRASTAGEPQIQALAMNHLAILNNDVDQIELSLEMLQKAGGLDLMRIAIVDYGDILKQDAQKSLKVGDIEQTRRTLERLQNLHRRLGHTVMAEKVANAIQTIIEVTPPRIQFDLSDLFGELDFKEIARAK